MHPASDQMVRNCERMCGKQAVRMFAPVHQGDLGAIEPARVLELGAVHHDILVERARSASEA